MAAPSTPQQHHWELWDGIAAARLQKTPIARSYAVYMSHKFMSNKYSISTRSGLQGCSAPPTPSQGSLADAQRDTAPLPCFSQLTVLGWGAQHRPPSRPAPRFAAALPLSPCQGLCRGLERGQRLGATRGGGQAAFLRRGLAPRARPACRSSLLSAPVGQLRRPGRGNTHGGLCHLHQPPARPGMLRA